MDLLSDEHIYEIALCAQKLDQLLPSEKELDPNYPVHGQYWYIGRRQDLLFAFRSNLYGVTASRVKSRGKLDALHRCDPVARGLSTR